jgi:hypothetical protein
MSRGRSGQGPRLSASISGLGKESVVLSPSRRRWLVGFALIAFLFAQSAALLHELGHAASGPDQQLPAGERTTLCKECVSHAPLLAMAGGAAVVLFLALQVAGALRPCRSDAPVRCASRRAVLARAPPR